MSSFQGTWKQKEKGIDSRKTLIYSTWAFKFYINDYGIHKASFVPYLGNKML